MNTKSTPKQKGLNDILLGSLPVGVKINKKSVYVALGINPRRFNLLMNDISKMTLDEATALAKYLNVEITEILNQR